MTWIQTAVAAKGIAHCPNRCKLKNDRMILVPFQGKPVNIKVIQVYSPTIDAKEDEVKWFCEDLQDFLDLT